MTEVPLSGIAYLDQLISSCDEMAARTGITFDGKTAMPFVLTQRTIRGLWETAMRCWDVDLYCDHALSAAFVPLPLYFLPTVAGPHAAYCGRCNPLISDEMWADLPRSTVKTMRCDACGKKFRTWRDIWPVLTNLLDWAVVGRCCFECRNIIKYNREDVPEPRSTEADPR